MYYYVKLGIIVIVKDVMIKMEYPQCQSDINIYQFNSFFNKELVFIGSKQNDATLKISKSMIPLMNLFIKIVDGTKSKSEIKSILIDSGYDVSAEDLLNIFANSGLLKDEKKRENNEIKIVGKKFIKIDFKPYSNKYQNVFKFLVNTYCVLLLISFIALCWVLGTHNSIITVRECFDIRSAGIIAIVINVVFIIFHELGHITYALANNIIIDSFEVRLQWGVMPLIFVKYRNLYFIKPQIRLKLILSGIAIHLLFFIASLALALVTNNIIVKAILINNFYNIINNILPYQLTDGYFAVCTLLNKYNLRINALRNLFLSSKTKSKSVLDILIMLLYVVMWLSVIAAALYAASEFAYSIYNIIPIDIQLIKYMLYVFILLQCILTVVRIKKNI